MDDQLKSILEQQLRDVHTPDAVMWWPLAIGWWVLIALVTCVIIFSLIRFIKHLKQNAYRRTATSELNQHFLNWQENQNTGIYLQSANSIIKRACSHFNRESMSLSGQAWINYLNTQTKVNFSSETEAALMVQLYLKAPSADINQVHREISAWLANHQPQQQAAESVYA